MLVRAFLRRAVALALVALGGAACSGSDAGGVSTPPAPIDESLVVTLTPERDSMLLGTTRTLSATVTSRSGAVRNVPVTWTSLSPAIVTVNGGEVTAVASGEARIVATAGSAADTASIQVFLPHVELRLTPGAVAATQGDTIGFEASIVTPTGASSRVSNVTWSLSDSTTAQLLADGAVATLAEGEVQVLATVDGVTAMASVQVSPAQVASITLAPSNLSLEVGKRSTMVATLRDARGRIITGREAYWTSSQTSVGTVSQTGEVSAIAPGGTVVTARVGGVSASAAVNVYSAAASSVVLLLPNDSLGTGRTMQVSANALDANGNVISGRPMAWQSSNPAVATINSSGIIAGVTSGQTTISVICDGKVSSQKVTVAVPVATTIDVSPDSALVTVGSTSRFTAEVRDQFGVLMSGQSYVWETSNSSIATISSTGVVTGKALGSILIRANAGSLRKAASVTVQDVPVASVTLSPTSPSVEEGNVVSLTATPRDSAGNVLQNRVVAWSSSAPSIATVSASGTVQGVSAGSSTITATVEGKSVSTVVTVTAPPPAAVAVVTVTLNASVLSVGQTTSAVAKAFDANGNLLTGRTVTFGSGNAGIATVSGAGLVKAIGAGSTTISATVDGETGIASVTVQPPPPLPVHTVSLTSPTNALVVGDSTQLTVVLRDSLGNVLTGRTIAYTSSSNLIATVTAGGKVRAVGAGSATIVATSEGKSASLGFTISAPPPPSPAPVATVAVALAASTIDVGQTTQATATLRDSTGTKLTGRTIAWSSSNAAVATVSQAGVVTAKAQGTAIISAQSEGKTGNASLTVRAPAPVVRTVQVTLASASIVAGSNTQVTAVARDSAGTAISGLTVTWSSSGGGSVATLASSTTATTTATGVAAGTSTITATISGVSGSATLTVTAAPPPPPPPPTSVTLPAGPTLISFAYPVVKGKTWVVNAGDNLQSALNQSQRGDEIVIEAGATFTGNFTLPAKTGTPANGWVLIRSSKSSQLPAQGTRVTPAHAALMPKIVTSNTQPALRTLASASGWWISGVEVGISPTVTATNYGLLNLGEGSTQTSLSEVPTDIVLDRMYVHGSTTSQLQRCVTLNSARSAVQDSYLFDCHGKGFDSQAILGWNGPGPFKIVNNTLAGAGENVMFGGADPSISGLIPSDIEFRRNYVYTPASWKTTWTKKNLLEIKNAQRMLISENVFDGSWADGQTGFALMIKVTNQGGKCTWCASADIIVRQNIIRNVGAGFSIQGLEGGRPYPVGALLNRVLVEQNIVESVNVAPYSGEARLISVMQNVQNLTIRSNTMSSTGSLMQYLNVASVPAATNFALQNNVFSYGTYGFFSSWYQQGEANAQAFRGTIIFQNTVMVGASKSGYPNGQFVSSLGAALATGFGANMSAVNAATQGVIIP